MRKYLAVAGAVAGFVAIMAAVSVALASGGTTTGGTTGTGDFTYDGQTISASAYGPPWTAPGAKASQSGWIATPLTFDCADGTLAMTDKVEYSGGSALTETFAPPSGTVIVGVLWKSGQDAAVTSATWADDGSSATVTLSKGWSDSRIFYCVQAESTTSVPTTTATTPTTTTAPTTTMAPPTTTAPAATTAPATTPSTTTSTPQLTPPPSKKHHHHANHRKHPTFKPKLRLPHTT